VTATAALTEFWSDDRLSRKVNADAKRIRNVMLDLASEYDADVRGRGMILGMQFQNPQVASLVSKEAFTRGLIIETAGPSDEVLKVLPPLTISEDELCRGLDIMAASVKEIMSQELVEAG
jgi:diaminobutyrate-2-oxoglutarate transaminase